jgi:hypothetical protein
VPMVGWPAKGSSPCGVQIRTCGAKLFGQRGHRLVRYRIGVEKHCELISGKGPIGEDVTEDKGSWHGNGPIVSCWLGAQIGGQSRDFSWITRPKV